jgi:hypothetical protein
MKPKTDESWPVIEQIPEDLSEKARAFVNDALRILAAETRSLASDITEFNQNRAQGLERIRRGARRTTGRVV